MPFFIVVVELVGHSPAGGPPPSEALDRHMLKAGFSRTVPAVEGGRDVQRLLPVGSYCAVLNCTAEQVRVQAHAAASLARPEPRVMVVQAEAVVFKNLAAG